jgi:hypothetical protein
LNAWQSYLRKRKVCNLIMPTLDHFFIFTKPNAPTILPTLEQCGFTANFSRIHKGQGTANRIIYFNNAYFETIWTRDEQEYSNPETLKVKMGERAHWKESGRSPFGICLRLDKDEKIPFETFDYKPEFLPKNITMQVAHNIDYLHEPMIFIIPSTIRPDQRPKDSVVVKDQLFKHKIGQVEVNKLTLTLPATNNLSETMLALNKMDFIQVKQGNHHHLTADLVGSNRECDITFDTNQNIDFRLRK